MLPEDLIHPMALLSHDRNFLYEEVDLIYH
jgi:hypothetical protein